MKTALDDAAVLKARWTARLASTIGALATCAFALGGRHASAAQEDPEVKKPESVIWDRGKCDRGCCDPIAGKSYYIPSPKEGNMVLRTFPWVDRA